MKLADFKNADAGIADLRRLMARFNDNRTAYPRDATVHALFARQADLLPDAVAVLHGERRYTYRQVDRASNRFARFLIGRGLRREERVAVMLESPFELVVSLLGILKAGGAYVPLDFDTPVERIRYVLDDTAARILVSEKRYIRLVNRLQWECRNLDIVCADSREILREPEGIGEMMREVVWDHVGQTAFDDISGGGWTSSYTGEWLGRDVMDEYGDNIRTKLRPYLTRDTRVLEIACGSGISLLRLAPLVGFYYATDLSRDVLARTEGEVSRAGLDNVRLQHLPAHDTDRVEEGGFDAVILNSVIQCFTGYNYLRDVLRKAIDRMADRGVMFLGNLWDLDRKDAFVRSLVEFRDAHPDQGYRTKIDRSEELFVSRDFLEDLRHDFPEIAAIECSGTIGSARSELSEYGYDALLHIDKRPGRAAAPLQPRSRLQFDLRAVEECDDLPVPEASGPEGLAYVIYTSGTSGRPKGVMVEHRSIARLVLDTNYIRLGPDDRVLQTGALAFDASTFEIWGALLNGGGLCRPPGRSILDPAELARMIAKHGITTIFLTTSLFNQHVDSDITLFAGLRYLLTGGERVSVSHVNRVRERYPELRLIHAYGPTENTTFTTCHPVERSYSGDIPIGRPIANTEVLILDESGALVPVGVAGEICAGGDGLARGYLNDPELTALKFVPHPWDPGRRIYRIGDSGLWRADGTIEFVGRLDDQIKIRGFRIEPAEIEAHILADPKIAAAVVLGRDVGGSGRELAAYVTLRKGGDNVVEGLRERLKRSLPDYMVPTHFIKLDRMPLNASGKVDRKALPDPVPAAGTGRGRHDPPANETERRLAAIWEEVLGHGGIGATDDFFDQGGHSLKVVKVVSLIEQRLGVTVPLTVFFTRPTVRELADFIVTGAKFGVPGIDDALVPLGGDPGGPALFAFPPGTGDALGYIQLAGLLPCRFYGFNFIPAASRLKDYADLIVATDPRGPYLLFGYSSGGNLAHAVAHELEGRGRQVTAVIMADSSRKLQRTPLSDEEIERVTANFLGDESLRALLNSPILMEKARRLVRASLDYVADAVDRHAIDADIHVLTSDDPITEYRDDAGTLLVSMPKWAELTRKRLWFHQGVGHHNYMLAHPHLDRNAELIRSILDGIIGVARGSRT